MKNSPGTTLFKLMLCLCGGVAGAQSPETEVSARLRELESRIAMLEHRVAACPATDIVQPTQPAQSAPSAPAAPSPATTVNVLLDGYYEYNFNRPANHVNTLRVLDPSSNSFTVNQGVVMVERSPDVAQGRRLGVRLDLMFGQSTENLSGNTADEPRTAPYRNIYQAYGTYVFPVGRGLNVDFGRFSSPIGIETAYAKDQMNYTRSLLYTALPLYHTGVRASYKINDSTTATWMLVNGMNQTEDFNGFKSTHLMVARSFGTKLNWTGGYYVGREGRDALDGRAHIADTYFTWKATDRLTLAGEGDYFISRAMAGAAPAHMTGGAGYVRYQLRRSLFASSRYEYISDRGAVFGGAAQAVKEITLTAGYQPTPGFEIRWEFRRDFSNRGFFPGRTTGIVSKEQNTALIGLLWWFGGKQGPW